MSFMKDMKKPICKVCDSPYHYQTFCPYAKKITIKKYGKEADKWATTRIEWFKKNASRSGYYYCHYCGRPMVMEETTLDHIKPRGSNRGLAHEFSNLVPCCSTDNLLKGSQSYEKFCERYYPRLLS